MINANVNELPYKAERFHAVMSAGFLLSFLKRKRRGLGYLPLMDDLVDFIIENKEVKK